jgi:hypothetical protein
MEHCTCLGFRDRGCPRHGDKPTWPPRFLPYLLLITLLVTPAFARHHAPAPRIFPTIGSLQQQNAEADRLNLPRIKNKAELQEFIRDGELAAVPTTPALRVNVTRGGAFLRPWAADTLTDLSRAFFEAFARPLTVNSATRTLDAQKRLRRWNRNAAPVKGATASVHPTGIAFDIKRRGLTPTQNRWLEWRLFYLQATGRVIVEEEFRQPCFHIVAVKL